MLAAYSTQNWTHSNATSPNNSRSPAQRQCIGLGARLSRWPPFSVDLWSTGIWPMVTDGSLLRRSSS